MFFFLFSPCSSFLVFSFPYAPPPHVPPPLKKKSYAKPIFNSTLFRLYPPLLLPRILLCSSCVFLLHSPPPLQLLLQLLHVFSYPSSPFLSKTQQPLLPLPKLRVPSFLLLFSFHNLCCSQPAITTTTTTHNDYSLKTTKMVYIALCVKHHYC